MQAGRISLLVVISYISTTLCSAQPPVNSPALDVLIVPSTLQLQAQQHDAGKLRMLLSADYVHEAMQVGSGRWYILFIHTINIARCVRGRGLAAHYHLPLLDLTLTLTFTAAQGPIRSQL